MLRLLHSTSDADKKFCFPPSTAQECSIRRPTSCLEQHFLGSGDSILRQSSWLESVRRAQVNLFASPESTHCKWFYSLSEARLSRMHWHTSGPRACANMRSPSEPTSTNTVQDQGGRGASPVSGSILAQQDPVPGKSCSSRQPLPGRFLWGRICFLRDGAPSENRALDGTLRF